jgi:hypothetical protein
MTSFKLHTSEVAMSGEIIEDDGSHTLTIGAISDVELRLTIAQALSRNEKVACWSGKDQISLADMWVRYVKGDIDEA